MSQVQLNLGDCLDVMRSLPDGSVDAVVTDPPYNEVNRITGGLRTINKGDADAAPIDIPTLAAEFVRLSRGSIYVWCCTEQVSEWRRCLVNMGLATRQGVWTKSNPSPMNGEKFWLSGLELCVFARKPKAPFYRFCKLPVWHGPSQRVPGFPCPKPVWLMRELITASVPEGGTVLDPFMGSGTTGIACANTNRNFIGIEKDERYFEIAQERIHKAQEAGRQLALAVGV